MSTKKRKSSISHAEFFPLSARKHMISPAQASIPQQNLNALAKKKWSLMKADLNSALNDWKELDTDSHQKSSEDQQLEKVKSLIEDLKMKLSDF